MVLSGLFMRQRIYRAFQQLLLDESGQSITEYGAIIGFVGVLIALAFNLAHGGFFAATSQAFSTTNSSLDALNQVGSSSS